MKELLKQLETKTLEEGTEILKNNGYTFKDGYHDKDAGLEDTYFHNINEDSDNWFCFTQPCRALEEDEEGCSEDELTYINTGLGYWNANIDGEMFYESKVKTFDNV